MKYLKYFAITILIGSVFLASCSKDESSSTVVTLDIDPAATQQATVFYFGGTWCGPCGTLGKPAKEALKKQLGDSKVSIVCCQQADPMNIPDGNDLAKLFNADRVPYMYVGGYDEPSDRVLVLSTMSQDAISKASTYLTKYPTANITASFYLNSDGVLKVDSKIKFFKDVTNSYYAAAYVTEDGIFATQTSDSSEEKNIHNSVLRAKMGSSITGDIISESSIKKDMVFKKSFEAAWDPKYKKEKLKAVVVVWMKNTDGTYYISNSIVVPIKI